MNIRPLREEDLAYVVGLAGRILPGRTDGDAFRKDFLTNDLARYFVAEAGDRPIGFLGLWFNRPNAEIIDIAIQEEFQRKGHGKALMNHAIQHCENEGVSTLTLETKADETKLRGFYGHFGFETVGRRKHYYHTGADAVLLAKRSGKDEKA